VKLKVKFRSKVGVKEAKVGGNHKSWRQSWRTKSIAVKNIKNFTPSFPTFFSKLYMDREFLII